jgi:hypothetical protein
MDQVCFSALVGVEKSSRLALSWVCCFAAINWRKKRKHEPMNQIAFREVVIYHLGYPRVTVACCSQTDNGRKPISTRRFSKGTFPYTHPQHVHSKLIRSCKLFSAKSTETNYKMVAVAAILKIETRRFSKGTCPYSPPTRTLKINSIGQAVLREIYGSQFQDGENRNTPIFERNLPILTPNTHTNNLIRIPLSPNGPAEG